MKKFKRRGGAAVTHLSTYEVELLVSLVRQLVDMAAEGEPEGFIEQTKTDDPFELWGRDLASDPGQPEPEDPVLQRWFPDAYPHDAIASSDFRRFTERELKAKKIADAQVVLDRLASTDQGARELRIPGDEVETWLRTLTSLRLAVAVRLGISDAQAADELAQLPDDDPRAFLANVYDWLGFAEETLITAID